MSDKNPTIIKKSAMALMDRTHRLCYGSMDILYPNAIKDYYNEISFSFDNLQRAESFFKAIHGDNYEEGRLRCMIPNSIQAPVIFLYGYAGEEQVFCIAPRIEDDLTQQCHDSVKRES